MFIEFRIAVRRLTKSPSFTLTALATLALCIGANLAIFAVVDALLIRPLPFARADRLLTLYYTYPKLAGATNGASITNYYERRGKIPALSSISEISTGTSVYGEAGSTSIEDVGRVTPEFFSTLGVTPQMGRFFREEELTYKTDQVAILSNECWATRFGSDSDVLGKSIRIDGIPRKIVGVLPKGFRFLSFQAPVYMPLSSDPNEHDVGARHSIGKVMIGRMAPGATMAAVQSQIDTLDAALAPEFPQAKLIADSACHTVVAPLQADFVAPTRPMLLLLQASASLLLAIGCVNLVNLLLIRANNRSRELAIRQALGASQKDVVREVMTETVILTLTGGVIGLAVGALGMRLLKILGAAQLPLAAQITFSWRVAAVALFGAVMTGIAVGAPVAWFNLRARFAAVLQGESRASTAGRASKRLRHGFIVAQIALAFVLLMGAGLLGLSLKRAMEVSPGFKPDHVITGRVSLTWAGYHDNESVAKFFAVLYEKTRSLPGVSVVGEISEIPVIGANENDVMTIPGYAPKAGEASNSVHDVYAVAGDYFAAMGVPLLEGRFLKQEDTQVFLKPCVVDANFARHYWPGESALGKSVYYGTNITGDAKPFTVVGVVGVVKQAGLTDTRSIGGIYFPYGQAFFRGLFLVARTKLPPDSVGSTLAKVVREVDPDMPLTDIRSMDDRITDSLATRRSPALMAGIFAITALLLATIGLYGVMAYTVVQRTREFGVRLALGAQRTDVLRLVLAQGVRLAAVGLALGIAASLLLTGFMSSLLFGLTASNPMAYAGVAALLALVASMACLIPAMRATKVDPMIALRCE